jgi:hypothetical protein
VELDPFFGPAHHTLAVLYARKGMHQEAIAEVEQGLGQYRCGARDEIARGLVYAMTGQLGEARERLSRLKQAYARVGVREPPINAHKGG